MTKPGPKKGTPNEYARKKAEERRLREENRAKPIPADTKPMQYTVLAGVGVIAVAAFAISYGALYRAALWTGWEDWQALLLPLLLDLGIVVFTFLTFIRMERGETILPTILLAETLTLISAFVNGTEAYFTSTETGIRLIIAVALAALPPLVLAGASYLAGRTIFERKVKA